MKIPRRNEIGDYESSLIRGCLVGLGYGAVASFGLATFLKRKTNFFQQTGFFHKSLVALGPMAFGAITNMEFASRDFEKSQRKQLAESGEIGSSSPRDTRDKISSVSDYMGLHKYKIVVAGWAAAMAGSFALVNRDKLMTKSQKVVQARVYAQGITVAMLLATIFLSVSSKEDDRAKLAEEAKTSWSRDLKFVQTEHTTK